ncbi:MAG: DUF4364 family protein [Defluviitaleaceae bacterium]|nr:DUF4364 family protein [Defluviitaleaceae bacterium]
MYEPSAPNNYKEVENKLIILYLINRMARALSRGQITDVMLDGHFMDYYTLQQNLSEMVDMGLLEASLENAGDNNTTRYVATAEGNETLDLLEKHILPIRRHAIDSYASQNQGKMKKEYEKTASYFPDDENDAFRVKCGIYEYERALLEVFVTVDTREQAKLIQSNWRNNPDLFGRILSVLTTAPLPNVPDASTAVPVASATPDQD